ncbi:hypothetical protein D3C81_1381990 [compost metagenome]
MAEILFAESTRATDIAALSFEVLKFLREPTNDIPSLACFSVINNGILTSICVIPDC